MHEICFLLWQFLLAPHGRKLYSVYGSMLFLYLLGLLRCVCADEELFSPFPNGTYGDYVFPADVTSDVPEFDLLLLENFKIWLKNTNIFIDDAAELHYYGGEKRYGIRITKNIDISIMMHIPFTNMFCGRGSITNSIYNNVEKSLILSYPDKAILGDAAEWLT